MWIKMDQKHTKGHEYQISEMEHQESKNNTEAQIGKHRPIRYDRNQLLEIIMIYTRLNLMEIM